jgi:hypothetical protein
VPDEPNLFVALMGEVAESLSKHLGIKVENLHDLFRPRQGDWEFTIKAAAMASLLLREFVFHEVSKPHRGGLGGAAHAPALAVIRELVNGMSTDGLLNTDKTHLRIFLQRERDFLLKLFQLRNKYAHEYRFLESPALTVMKEVWPGEVNNRIRILAYREDEKSLPDTPEALSNELKAGFIRFLLHAEFVASLKLNAKGGLLALAIEDAAEMDRLDEEASSEE